MDRARSIGAITLVVVLAACGPAASSAPPSPGSPGAPVTASPEATIAPDIAYAIHQREQFGLRADLAWVLAVAADPRARIALLDFLMLPEEEAQLTARQADYDAVVEAVREYASTKADQFGGVYIDQARHTVVALWTADPAVHRLEILRRLGRLGPLEVRLARYAERDLSDLQDRIGGDWDWLAEIQARPTGVGVDIIGNFVGLEISSANPDAAGLILAHYGVPAAMLRVGSDGTGILLLPPGTIRGTVVTADGKAPGPNQLMVTWLPDGDGQGRGDCGIGDMGYGVGDQGRFELPCAPGGWTITIKEPRDPSGNGDWTPVGSGHAVVPPGGEVSLRITLDPGVAVNP